MSSKIKIDARANFIDLLSTTEKTNKNDYMLNFLVNKTKEDFKKQVLYATSKNIYLDSDIYSQKKRKSHKFKTKIITSVKKPIKRNSIQFKFANLNKKSYSIGNVNLVNNMILNLDSNKNIDNNFNNFVQIEEENDMIFNEGNKTERKNYDKLDNLNSILKLIDIHEKTQYQLMDENEKKNLNMLRNRKKHELYHTCITYNKNNLFYNKKYRLIFDKDKSINKLYFQTHENKKTKNSHQINKNNINSLLTETNLNNKKPFNSNRIQSPLNYISLKDKSNKIPQTTKKRNLFINSENTETREVTHFTNFSESNIFKTYSSTNSSKNKIFKPVIDLNQKKTRENNKNKQIFKVYSEVLKNYKKIKHELNNNYFSDRKGEEEKKKNEMNIKNLIKKKKTNLKILTKELDLNYDRDNVDLEEIILNKKNKIKERMRNAQQRRLLNQIQQQVINEDKILSKKIILENNLEKKLKSRTKRLNERLFEEMTLKRKRLKHHLIGFKLVEEKDYINKLMKNEVLNFNTPKSLQVLLHKYKIMKFS